MNNLAANLRKLRIDKKLTQEQAAAKLGVSAQSVSRWETAATLPDVMLLPDIARRLDARGLEIEAQWPREMAKKCRAQVK